MSAPRILCVSFDAAVSNIRSAALQHAGYSVVPTIKIAEALELLSRERFDLVLIGHRFSHEEKRSLATMAKQEFKTPVLLVREASVPPDIPADAMVYALDGTSGILKAAELLLAKARSAAA
ncbi:MAG: hypothetical protein ACE14M_10605 [Terriglobales bacterium]